MYHFVMDVPEEFPSLKTLPLHDFTAQLDLLLESYTPVPVEELRRAIRFGTDLPKNSFVLTFDHGTKDHIDIVLPELEQRGLDGCFYITTCIPELKRIPIVDKQRFLEGYFESYAQFYQHFSSICLEYKPELANSVLPSDDNLKAAQDYLRQFSFYSDYERLFRKVRNEFLTPELYKQIFDRMFLKFLGDESLFVDKYYLSWDDIQKMAHAGMSIGSHGHNHILYSESNLSHCLDDVQQSYSLLKNYLPSYQTDSLSYPNGAGNAQLYRLFNEIGVNYAYTTGGQVFTDLNDQYNISRIDTTQLYL